jgi:hypothetical protein
MDDAVGEPQAKDLFSLPSMKSRRWPTGFGTTRRKAHPGLSGQDCCLSFANAAEIFKAAENTGISRPAAIERYVLAA